MIKLSVESTRFDLLVDDAELKKHRNAWVSNFVPPESRRGYDLLYASEGGQADEGCDFSFMLAVDEKII